MSERRLTDEELRDVIEKTRAEKCHACKGEGWTQAEFTRGIVDCTDCEGTGMFALSTEVALSAFEELRERRAADLSEQDRSLLSIIRGEVLDMGILALRSRQEADPTFRFRSRDHEDEENAALTKRALALLDRLLSRGEGGR